LTETVWTAEKAAEFEKLDNEWAVASATAATVLRTKGMESDDFRKADAVTTDLWVKLRKLQGAEGKSWMA
jgi:hypothetical protein